MPLSLHYFSVTPFFRSISALPLAEDAGRRGRGGRISEIAGVITEQIVRFSLIVTLLSAVGLALPPQRPFTHFLRPN